MSSSLSPVRSSMMGGKRESKREDVRLNYGPRKKEERGITLQGKHACTLLDTQRRSTISALGSVTAVGGRFGPAAVWMHLSRLGTLQLGLRCPRIARHWPFALHPASSSFSALLPCQPQQGQRRHRAAVPADHHFESGSTYKTLADGLPPSAALKEQHVDQCEWVGGSGNLSSLTLNSYCSA